MSEMLTWLRATIEGDKAAAEAAGGEEWVLGKDGQQLYLAPANAEPEPWRAEQIAEWTYVVDHCCHPEQWDECDTAKQEHIVIHDPRDTIARCDAELAFLDAMVSVVDALDYIAYGEGQGAGDPDRPGEVLYGPSTYLLKKFALGYRHRPGFKPEWVAE